MNSFDYETIVGKKERPIDISIFKKELEFRHVLVVGIGSIGTELVKQLSECDCKLTLIDMNENSLINIKDYLDIHGFKRYRLFLDDAKDPSSQEWTNQFYDYVINAAAYKHVIFCEENHVIARKNNLGIAKFLLGIPAFKHLLISSDKAVNPTTYMGKTKRLCEFLYLEKNNAQIVRFGNVYASSGSLIPRLINCAESGTIYLTDKNATRYFITIKEACYLIIDTLVYSDKKVGVLNMGEPIKIIDIINRFIKEYPKPLIVKEVGLLPNEKRHEELSYPQKLSLDKIQFLVSLCSEEEKVESIIYDVDE